MRTKHTIKIISLFAGLLAIPLSVKFLTTSPDVARLLGRSVGATGAVNLETPNPVTPSISGFSSDLSTGTSSISYPFDLPTGPAGFKPSLSLSYSGSSVDDMHVGIPKECWGNDTNGDGIGDDCYDWQETYYNQASWIGMGWNLGGLGYIARKPGLDNEATVEKSKDDEFFLVFPGGAARLIDKSPNSFEETGKQWETDPKLFLKIEHDHLPYNQDFAFDTAPWIITTPDGTKYYFGQPVNNNGFFLKQEDAADTLPINYSLAAGSYNQDLLGIQSLATGYSLIGQPDPQHNQQYAKSKIMGNRWLLRKIVNVYSQEITIDYESRFKKVSNFGDLNGWSSDSCYPNRCPNAIPHDITPRQISWGKNSVEFNKIYDRADYKIKDYDKDNQNSFTLGKLNGITIKVDGTIKNRYDFTYSYSQPPARSPSGQVTWGNLLLNQIQLFGKNGTGTLPAYKFGYYTDGANRFNNTLLAWADNGYGGKVTYNYEGPQKVYTCSTADKCTHESLAMRNRLVKTKTEDGMGNYFETNFQYFSMSATTACRSAGVLSAVNVLIATYRIRLAVCLLLNS